MADLIPASELTTLKSAADVLAVAEDAPDLQAEMSLAYDINYAANTGLKFIVWAHDLTESLKTKVETLGYTVKDLGDLAGTRRWRISWE